MVDVREAIESDHTELQRLWTRFMAEETQAVPEPDVAQAAAPWSERLRSAIERRHVHVVDAGGEVQGFAMWRDSADKPWIAAGVAYIVDIYLLPEGRKAQTAAKLLKSLLSASRDLGYREVWTNTHAGNHRVKVLLGGCGFVQMSGFDVPGLKDQLYYRKALA